MSYVIGILTFILFLDSLLLILLILIQLPKKDAGAGTAFGGGTTDALFGAGSGNALTKITKWAASIFLGLALLLSALNSSAHRGTSNIRKELNKQAATAPAVPVQPAPVPSLSPSLVASNQAMAAITNIVSAFGPTTTVSNAAVATATNAVNALESAKKAAPIPGKK